MGYTLLIDIPILPPTTNTAGFKSRNHWVIRKKKIELQNLVMNHLLPFPRPKTPMPKALITLTRLSSVQPDFDGLVSSFKLVLDALVKMRILENDAPKNIGYPSYLWEKTSKGNGSIRIKIEEISGELNGR